MRKIQRQYYKKDFYEDVYVILNRIELTLWTICAFRVMNPHQWSLGIQSGFKSWKWLPESDKQGKAKRDDAINK